MNAAADVLAAVVVRMFDAVLSAFMVVDDALASARGSVKS